MITYTSKENYLLQGKELVFSNSFLVIRTTLVLAKHSQVPLLELLDRWFLVFSGVLKKFGGA